MKYNTVKNYGSICKDQEEEITQEFAAASNFKRIASQCCGVLTADCLKFTTGTFVGFHIIIIAELHKVDAEIDITLNQLTWMASLNFLVPIGSIINGFVSQYMGCRFVMMLSSIFFIVSWLIYHKATTATMIIAGRVLYSLVNGAQKTPSSSYITEISETHLRGSFLATNHVASALGMFFSLLLSSVVYWRKMAVINTIFPILSVFMILLIPESPIWLAHKGRFEEAEMSLSWLRGWVHPSHVRSEYFSLIETVEKSSSLSANPDMEESVKSTKRTFFKKWLEPFFHRSFYLPLCSITLIYIIHFFSGLSAIQTYSMVIFREMNAPIDEHIATAVMGGTRVVGSIVTVLSIRFTGKRRLIFLSLIVAGCCYFLISTVGFLIQQQQVTSNGYFWISPVAMIAAIFINSLGVETVVQMLNSEIFPVSVRYIGSSFGNSISSVMQSLMSKAFLYIVDVITLPGIFLYFTVMNVVALITYYFLIPETEGKSLNEIEDHYGGIKNLNGNSKDKCCTEKI